MKTLCNAVAKRSGDTAFANPRRNMKSKIAIKPKVAWRFASRRTT
jgi:hypothetical protein